MFFVFVFYGKFYVLKIICLMFMVGNICIFTNEIIIDFLNDFLNIICLKLFIYNEFFVIEN